jgi:hypothetical protein
MKAQIASILLVALCTLTPAFAQDTASQADKPSQAQIDAATDLLKANNAAANMQAILDVMLPLQAAEIRRQHPNASDETVKQLLKIVNEAISNHIDDLIRLYAIAYSRRFTIDEMHALADFYRSDVGQKYLKEVPGLMKDMTPLAVAYLQGAIRQEIETAVENLRKQGVKI